MLNARNALWTIGAILLFSSCSYAASYQIFATIEQKNELALEPTYNFRLSVNRWLIGSDSNVNYNLELTSPQNLSYSDNGLLLDFIDIKQNGLTHGELSTNFLGNWIFEESLAGVTKRYQIAVPQLPAQFFDITAPEILSPSNGAVVSKVFHLLYTNPDPNGIGITYSTNANLSLLLRNSFRRNAPGDYTVSLANYDYSQIEFGRFNIVKKLTSPSVQITPLTSNADGIFSRSISYEVHSNTIAFTVVPEPHSVAVLLMGCVAVMGRRKRMN